MTVQSDWNRHCHQLQALKSLSEEEREAMACYFEIQTYPLGQMVVSEGMHSSEMFFLLEGKASIQRAGLQIGRISRGSHFGELSLITGHPRSASVLAETKVLLARLSNQKFEKMQSEAPQLALQLMQELIRALGYRLVEMTDSYGLLLQERSLPRKTHLRVRVGDTEQDIQTGAVIQDLLPAKIKEHPVVAAFIKNKLVGLTAQVFSDTEIQPLTTEHWEGERIYRRSAGLLCLESAYQLLPQAHFSLGLGVGGTQWISISGPKNLELKDFCQQLQAKMDELIQENVLFRQEIWNIEEAIEYFQNSSRPDVSYLLQTYEVGNIPLVSCGQHYILSTGPLLPSAGRLSDIQIVASSSGLVLRTDPTQNLGEALSPYAKLMQSHERWLKSLNIDSAGKFNQACINGNVTQLIRVSEGYHEKRISLIADQIAEQRDKIRVVCIAGPSSSGKTTFIKRLNIQLQVNGLNPKGISLDDYYIDRVQTPLDEFGELDFEALEALNLKLLGEDILALLAGKTTKTAKYNFIEGINDPQGGPELSLKEGDLLMLEGIHGINPKLLPAGIAEEQIFRVFIQPMASLSFDSLSRVNPSDMRLLRRIVRDRHQRGTNPVDNIMRWASVRRGEQKHIFPYVKEADVIFDTSLVYELAVLKVFAERYLLEVPVTEPAYATAYRLRMLLNLFVPIYPDHVPQTSILREFIGNSGFDY